MKTTTTPRRRYAKQLQFINKRSEYTTGSYYRTMTFAQTKEWIEAYQYFSGEGYPADVAKQYAWDCHFAGLRGAKR